VKKDNEWIKAFHKHGLGDVKKAVQVADDALSWRQSMDINSEFMLLCFILFDSNYFNIFLKDLLKPGKLPFNEAMLADGGLFMRNKDKNGRPFCKIFVIICYYELKSSLDKNHQVHFRVKNYKKGKYPFEDNCKYIAYFLEKEYTFSLNKPIVLLFDMNGAGMSGAVIFL
jgi:hypothetical protein